MGLICAFHLHRLGEKDIIILEKEHCGSGASGLSAGFITPESELTFSNIKRMFGNDTAHQIFNFSSKATRYIGNIIKDESISCDYQQQDCVVVAENKSEMKNLINQAKDREKANQESKLYTKENIHKILTNPNYLGALRYGDTFSINPLAFCLQLRDILIKKGIKIFENTEVQQIQPHNISANNQQVKAKFIYSCLDKFTTDLSLASSSIHKMRTTVIVSQPLSENHLKKLFPANNFLLWDSKLIYNYFRILNDNRLLFGGSTLRETYWNTSQSRQICEYQLISSAKEHLQLNSISIHSCWSGNTSISRNLLPYLEKNKNLYISAGPGGLPWAAAMGIYMAESAINNRNDLDEIFAKKNISFLELLLNKLAGKSTSFAYSNWKAMH